MQSIIRLRALAVPLFVLLLWTAGAAQNTDTARSQAASTRLWPPALPGTALDAKDSIAYYRDAIALSQLRETLHGSLRKARTTDSVRDDRPGRSYLRTTDSTLFSNNAGSVGGEYPLGPGDVLILSIWGQKQARYDLEIDRDGLIQIPSVGQVSLNGVNFKDVKSILSRRLATAYSGIQTGLTQIDVSLQKLKQVRVFVVGDVARPGGYVLSGTSSSLQAVAVAGGPTDRGSERIVKITRGDSTHDVDLYTYLFLGRRPQRDVLQDGDVVRVAPSLGTARVDGSVARPGRYEILPSESVADLVALAGGPSPDADPDAPVRLVRDRSGSRVTNIVGNSRTIDVAGKGVAIQAGDVVSIQSRQASRRSSPTVGGFVRNPGEYPYEQGLTARRLLSLAGGATSGALLKRVVVIRPDSVGTGAGSILTVNLEGGPDLTIFPADSMVVPGQSLPDSVVRVKLSGAVHNPGVYDWFKGMRLNDLLLLAGGLEPWADRKGVRISERSPAGPEIRTRTVSLDVEGEASDPILSPYAAISVPAAPSRPALPGSVQVVGHVRSPETYALNSARERLSSVVRRAGGLDSVAYPEGAVLWRATEGRIPANLAKAISRPGGMDDVVLQPDDSLYVPARPATVVVAGYVNRPTRVLWQKGKGWSWYVRSAGDFADSANVDAVYVQYADGSIQSLEQGPDDPTPGSTVYVPRREPPRPASTLDKVAAFGTIATAISTIVTVVVVVLASQK